MRNFLKAIASRITGTRQQTLSLIANWLANLYWLIDTKFMPLAKEAYAGNSAIYTCLSLLSQSVPEAPLRVYIEAGGGDRTVLDKKHDLSRLIAHPNNHMTEFEFWELSTLQLCISGRSVWWKQRSNNGQIMALWPLRPDRVGPIYAGAADEDNAVLWGYSYLDPTTNTPFKIERRDVLAINLPDPSGESGGIVEGLGPLQALAPEISADNEATKFVGALLANYAAPTVALKTKAAIRNEAEANQIKANFRHEFGGARRGTPALLDGDTTVELLGFNLQQLEFPGVRMNTESRICAALGIPPALVGIQAGAGAARGLGGGGALNSFRQYFTETTLMAFWRRYADQYTQDVASEYGDNIVCEFDLSNIMALAGRRQEKIVPIKEAFEKGVVTRNEYRAVIGFPIDPAGDVYLIPSTIIEIQAGQEPRVLPTKGIKSLDSRDAEEMALIKRMTSILGTLGEDVARRIYRGEVVSDTDIADAFRGIEVELVQAATEEAMAQVAVTTVGFDPAVINAEAIAWAHSYSYDLVKGLVTTTRDIVARATEAFLRTPGMTVGDITRLLEPAFGRARAEMIAVTETTRAVSEGQNVYQRLLADAGIEMGRVWQTAGDELVCPICGPLNGQTEAEWVDSHPSGPPAHPRCRCRTSLSVLASKAHKNGHKVVAV